MGGCCPSFHLRREALSHRNHVENYLNPDAGDFRNEYLRTQHLVSEMGRMERAKIEADLKHLCSAFDENVQTHVLWHDSLIDGLIKAPLPINLTVPIFGADDRTVVARVWQIGSFTVSNFIPEQPPFVRRKLLWPAVAGDGQNDTC